MPTTTIAQPAHQSTPVEKIAEAVEAEFDRLKVARPALLSRIVRAEHILVTHLSRPAAGIIKPRICGGELVAYLVKGSSASGAVYRVEPGTFSCSCPDFHRRGKGCKHGIACYALGRAFRPAPPPDGPRGHRRGPRPGSAPKRLRQRHDVGSSEAAASEKAEPAVSTTVDSYGETTCSRCLNGLVYDGQHGEWVACERCEGSGRVMAFVYPKAGSSEARRLLAECAGCGQRYPHRELVEVTEDHDSLTFFEGDKLCLSGCAGPGGVL